VLWKLAEEKAVACAMFFSMIQTHITKTPTVKAVIKFEQQSIERSIGKG
jgi:hypothetical protein